MGGAKNSASVGEPKVNKAVGRTADAQQDAQALHLDWEALCKSCVALAPGSADDPVAWAWAESASRCDAKWSGW